MTVENPANYDKITTPLQCVQPPCGESVQYRHKESGAMISELDFEQLKKNHEAATKPTSYKVPSLTILAPMLTLFIAIFIAYKRKSSVLGWIGWILVGGLLGAAIAKSSFLMANKDRIGKEI